MRVSFLNLAEASVWRNGKKMPLEQQQQTMGRTRCSPRNIFDQHSHNDQRERKQPPVIKLIGNEKACHSAPCERCCLRLLRRTILFPSKLSMTTPQVVVSAFVPWPRPRTRAMNAKALRADRATSRENGVGDAVPEFGGVSVRLLARAVRALYADADRRGRGERCRLRPCRDPRCAPPMRKGIRSSCSGGRSPIFPG